LVEHEVAADLIGTVGEAMGMLLVRTPQEKGGGVDRTAGNNHLVTENLLDSSVRILVLDVVDGASIGRSEESEDMGSRDESDVLKMMNRTDAVHVGVGLGVGEAGVAVAGVAADAGAVLGMLFVEFETDGNRERMVAVLFQSIEEFLDPRLIADGRIRIFGAHRRLSRIDPAQTMDIEEFLGAGVVGLEDIVSEGPCGRDPSLVT
jgi:hypothetical protein